MKSNVKRFLSTLCVLTSVSGIFAPALVKASSDVEKYGNDFCGEGDHSVCSSAAAAATVTEDVSCDPATILMPLFRKENHQEFYDKVIELLREEKISLRSAYFMVLLDQMVESSKTYADKFLSYDEIKKSISTGKWNKERIVEMFDSMFHGYVGPRGDLWHCSNLECRAIAYFEDDCLFYLFKGDFSILGYSLKHLNPRSPLGI